MLTYAANTDVSVATLESLAAKTRAALETLENITDIGAVDFGVLVDIVLKGPDALAFLAARGAAPVIENITREDLIAIVQHILDTPGDWASAHYFDLFFHNTSYRTRDLITGPPRNNQPPPSAK